METNIGSKEQWRKLEARHPGLMQATHELIGVWGKVAETPVKLPTLAHEIVFALSRMCMEECWEVFLLAANQYARGVLKTLRGLYERALTLAYIRKFPEKATGFQNYAAIQEHKLLVHARKLAPDETLNQMWRSGTIAEVEANYERIKPLFQRTKCKKCKTTETAHAWDIDLASMAEKTGDGFEGLYLPAYLVPTLEAHTTLASTFSRVTTTDDGLVTFNYERDTSEIDLCLMQTFALVDLLLQATIEIFELPLGEDMKRFQDASFQAWRERETD